MGVRDGRGAGLRRAAAGRAGFVALAAALYLAAGVLATWPAVEHVGSHFLAERSSPIAGAAPGDHLQTGWNLWLFGHQLEQGNAPWRDPYSFRPELAPRVNFQGLVFGLPYWPLFALFGAVVAWNLFTLLTFVGAGVATLAWLRSLGLPRGAALVGGLAFALAPYRVAQSTGHLLGPISLFVALALLAIEKRRSVLAAAAIAAIPLSGQVSLALGAVPLFVAYAFVRGRGETFVFVGWLTPALALAGLALLLRDRRYGLAALLAAAVVVPIVIALGTHLPTYRWARHVVPGLKVARVPERLLPLACLALAALLAFALVRARPWLVVLVLVLVAADLHVRSYHSARADEGNAAYAALRSAPAGRLLELPVFAPDVQLNSTYLYYDMAAPRQHPGGYSTTVSRPAFRTARRLRVLTCGTWSPDMTRLGIRHVAIHRGFYERFFPRCRRRAEATLRRHGFRRLTADGPVAVWSGGP